jgi:predicted nucleic acid-binding protein
MSRLMVAEPGGVFQVRPPLVIDCSALAAIVFAEPEGDLVEQRIVGHDLHAPHLLQAELAQVALVKHRRGESHALPALDQATSLPIDLHALNMSEVVGLAERYALTAFDAAYLWLAARLSCPLITLDRRLGRAAIRHFGGAQGF